VQGYLQLLYLSSILIVCLIQLSILVYLTASGVDTRRTVGIPAGDHRVLPPSPFQCSASARPIPWIPGLEAPTQGSRLTRDRAGFDGPGSPQQGAAKETAWNTVK